MTHNNNSEVKNRNLSELTDQELLQEAKKRKTTDIANAVLIGALLEIFAYSVVKNSWGFLTLIPLVFAYYLINQSKRDKQELERLLKERNLK
jgi:hypothetical protein